MIRRTTSPGRPRHRRFAAFLLTCCPLGLSFCDFEGAPKSCQAQEAGGANDTEFRAALARSMRDLEAESVPLTAEWTAVPEPEPGAPKADGATPPVSFAYAAAAGRIRLRTTYRSPNYVESVFLEAQVLRRLAADADYFVAEGEARDSTARSIHYTIDRRPRSPYVLLGEFHVWKLCTQKEFIITKTADLGDGLLRVFFTYDAGSRDPKARLARVFDGFFTVNMKLHWAIVDSEVTNTATGRGPKDGGAVVKIFTKVNRFYANESGKPVLASVRE